MTVGTDRLRAAPGNRLLSQAVVIPLVVAGGVLYAYCVVGGSVLDPLNVTWFKGDPATAQVGWEFFRRSSEFWPLTYVAKLGYPFGTSIAYLDSIPLVAVLFRPFAALLPEDFQYLGLFFAINLVLQGYFAVRLLRNVVGEDSAAVLIGAAFIVVAPPLAFRGWGHFALTAHWLIVAALSYYAANPSSKGAVRYLRPFFVLAAIAGGINPYLTLMTLLAAAAAVLRAVLRRLLHPLQAIAACGALGLVAAGSLALFGFFSLREGYAIGGHTNFSMNILAPIDPWILRSLLLPQQTIAAGQYEGYNYLGLGVIAMLVIGLALRPRSLRELASADVLPLVALSVICFLLAVSTHVRFGPWLVIKIGPGTFITNLLASFRGSGRLYWPAHYLLILGAIILISRIVPVRFRGMTLAALLIVQIADTQSLRREIRSHWDKVMSAAPLAAPVWRTLGKDHRHLVVVPPWQCGTRVNDEYWIFPMLAVRQGMSVNSYYAGRYSPRQIAYFCSEHERIRNEGMRSDTAYVLSDEAYDALIAGGFTPTHNCRKVDGFQLCTR